MLKWIFNYNRKKLNTSLGQAIFWGDVGKVQKLLKRGADPNGWAGRQRFLGKALEKNSQTIIKALLESGADPRLPYLKLGMEFKMSEAARLYEYHDLAVLLEQAERDAEDRLGKLPLRELRRGSCTRKPRI